MRAERRPRPGLCALRANVRSLLRAVFLPMSVAVASPQPSSRAQAKPCPHLSREELVSAGKPGACFPDPPPRPPPPTMGALFTSRPTPTPRSAVVPAALPGEGSLQAWPVEVRGGCSDSSDGDTFPAVVDTSCSSGRRCGRGGSACNAQGARGGPGAPQAPRCLCLLLSGGDHSPLLPPPDASSPPRPSPQTELSLQKEQLQLKIIELEDEADKWQKEKDRIKVHSRPSRRGSGHVDPTLVFSRFSHSRWRSGQFLVSFGARGTSGILPIPDTHVTSFQGRQTLEPPPSDAPIVCAGHQLPKACHCSLPVPGG